MVGNGNVATDVARMLALTREELASTDVADHALDVLAESNVTEIVVLGRRGPAQAAFTNPELLELGEMTDADVFVDPGDVELDPLSKAFIESEAAHTTKKKNVEILHRLRRPRAARASAAGSCCASSSRRSRSSASDRVEGIRIVHNELAEGDDGALRPRPTDISEELDCGLVFRSIGYRGTRIDGRAVRRAELHDPERGRPHRGLARASTRSAGSSAGRPGSSARTSATPRRR